MDTDFIKLVTACQKKPLHEYFLYLERVPISNCLLVSGFLVGTSEKTLESYFENEERSGGGTVTCVKVNHSDCTCLVYFDNHSGNSSYEVVLYHISTLTLLTQLKTPYADENFLLFFVCCHPMCFPLAVRQPQRIIPKYFCSLNPVIQKYHFLSASGSKYIQFGMQCTCLCPRKKLNFM